MKTRIPPELTDVIIRRDNCSSKDAPKLRRALMEVGLVVEPGDVDKILHAYADPRYICILYIYIYIYIYI